MDKNIADSVKLRHPPKARRTALGWGWNAFPACQESPEECEELVGAIGQVTAATKGSAVGVPCH